MKIIISGITGVVGSNLASELKSEGHEVLGLSRSSSPIKNNITIDLGNSKSVEESLCRITEADIFVHCAASIDNNCSLEELIQSNVIGTLNALKIASVAKVKVFINISTTAVYGPLLYLPVDENHPCAPKTPYALSKYFAEQALQNLRSWHYDYNGHIPAITSFRIPSPVGKGMPMRSILPIMLNQSKNGLTLHVSGDSGRKQNFLDIRDLAYAIIAASKADSLQPVYNIGALRSYSNLDLAESINHVTGNSRVIVNESFSVEYTTGQLNPQCWDLSIELSRTSFGFIPKFELIETLCWIANSDSH